MHLAATLIPLTLLTLTSPSTAVLDLDGRGLVDVPWGLVPVTETVLKLTDNTIVEVPYAPPGTSIQRLLLGENRIATFPNLANLSDTLTYLGMANNYLTRIEGELLAQLTELRTLQVGNNPLVGIPDPAMIPAKLWVLQIGGTPVETIPNMCRKPGFKLTVKHQQQVSFLCDRRMLWARVAYDVNRLKFDVTPTCRDVIGSPQLSWDNLTLAYLSDLDGDGGAKYRRLTNPADFYCYPTVTEEVFGVRSGSKVDCSRRCASASSSPVCLMFAVDHGRCFLAHFSPGEEDSGEDFRSFKEWYALQ